MSALQASNVRALYGALGAAMEERRRLGAGPGWLLPLDPGPRQLSPPSITPAAPKARLQRKLRCLETQNQGWVEKFWRIVRYINYYLNRECGQLVMTLSMEPWSDNRHVGGERQGLLQKGNLFHGKISIVRGIATPFPLIAAIGSS